MAICEPSAAFRAACRSTYGGHTAISSRVCSNTCGRKALKKSSVCVGFLYIFQLAAISFLRAIRYPFKPYFVNLGVLCGLFFKQGKTCHREWNSVHAETKFSARRT